MKTKKHGKGLNHNEVVRFSNRLSYSGKRKYGDGFSAGWSACAKYFAHELRSFLRECESLDY